MSTLRELSFDLLNILRAGRAGDVEAISLQQIQFWIKTTRATLLRQELNKGKTVSENYIQHIYNQLLEVVDISDCPINLPIGCYIVKTKNKIPRFLEINDRDMVLSIQPNNIQSQNYTFIPRARLSYLGFNKWNKHMSFAFLREGYIYIINDPNVEYITIEGIFENPEDLAGLNNCITGTSCYSDEDKYPISEWMWDTMKQMIMKTNFSILNNPTDISENGNPDYKQNTQKPPIG